ncbi:MAG: ATP-binding cassette domain-containing protein [Planctomycetota bacterium]
MLELRGVSKSYANIHGLDLEVSVGKTLALLGQSGCGKSTLLRMMLRLVEPDGGEVLFDEKPVTPNNVESVRRRVGYVIQSGGLFPHLTAADNVTLLARRIGHKAIGPRTRELAELVHLPGELLDRYPGELSGGQRQRVALMRALMTDPDALLLDEPLGALDPIIRADLQRDLREIFRSLGKTVVMVTHDLAEAAYFADEVVLMRDGSIVQRGTPADLRERPADDYVKAFINAQRLTHETEAA